MANKKISDYTLITPTGPEVIEVETSTPTSNKVTAASIAALANVMTAAGDMTIGGVAGAPTRVAKATDGNVWMLVSGEPAWAAAGGLTNPMTTAGDSITGGVAGAPTRLPIGTNGQVKTVVSGAEAWATLSGLSNPMTAVGDVIVGGAAGAATRLGIGTNTFVLTSNGTTASWAAPSGGMTNPMTTVGDMIIGGTAGAPTRVAIGANTYVWTSNGTTAGWAAATGVALSNTSAWTKNQYVAPSTLTYAATVTPNASLSNNFVLTMTGACTLANPTSLQSGMVLNFCLNQDATGGRVITFGSAYKWPGGTAPTWITTASAKNFFSAYYDGTILRCNGGAGYA